jgi:outer membrane lipoprotein SlyB
MKIFRLGILILLGGCASTPSGPGVLVLPGSGKSFDQFRVDEHECRQYASSQVGGQTPGQAANDAGVKSAVVGAAVGTVAGAALGGHHGAGVGAGVGLAAGALAGT